MATKKLTKSQYNKLTDAEKLVVIKHEDNWDHVVGFHAMGFPHGPALKTFKKNQLIEMGDAMVNILRTKFKNVLVA